MKTLTAFSAAAALFGTLLAAAAPAHADASYDTYRRVVLGDTSIAAPAKAEATGVKVVPGPYAQYLIYTGVSTTDAVAAASRIGEQAVYRNVLPAAPQRQLTAAEAYARYLGNDGLSPRRDAVGSAE